MNCNIFKWSFNTRITTLALAIFLVGIWSLTLYATHIQREDTQRLLSDQQFSTATMVASDIDQEITERMSALEKVAEIITPAVIGNAPSMQAFLENRITLQSYFSGGLFVTRLDGMAIADVPLSKGRTGVNYIDRDYIAGAIKKGKTAIGTPVIGKKLKSPIIGMATPIRDVNGTVIGVLAAIIDLSKPNFLNKITENSYGKTGGYLIVSKQQRQIVTATDKKRMMEILPAPGINPFIDRAIQGFEGTGITTTPKGVQVLASTKGITSAGWYVVALLPSAEAFAPIESMQKHLILATFILTLLAAGLYWWFLKIQRVKETLADQVLAGVEELKKAEELYHSLVETSQDLIWRCDAEGRYTYLNLAWEQTLGYELNDMLGKRFNDFMIHENAVCFETEFNQMMDGGNSLHGCEAIYRGKNGEDIHLVFNALLSFDEDGEYFGASGTAFNLSGRKQMEIRLHETADQLEIQTGELQMFNESLELRVYERTLELEDEHQRLEGIIRGTNVGTWEWNVQTGETIFNERWAEIIGYKLYEISPVSIETWMKYGHPDDLKGSGELLEKHFRGELDYYEFESRMQHKNGSWVWVLDRGKVASWTEDGKPLMMLGTHQDITESKKLKEQLMQSQKMEAVGQLAGGLAHDFNNVLSIINGYSSLLQMDLVMNEEQKDSFERILAASKRAGELTHSMLAFSRTQVMNSQNQELNFVVSKVGSFVEKIIGDHITFKIIINEANLPVYVDSGQIEQIMINLANNARDAMPNGGTLEITTDSIAMDAGFIATHGFGKPGRYAVIAVSDSGTGMDEATREKIFEPFFTTKDVDKGTGLGLAMVYGITKQHNGYVNVYSEPGHGSCFKIYLPIVVTDTEDSGVKTVDGLETSVGTETILIAEDNADVRQFMNKLLTRRGYQVICAVDGQDAVEKFHENADKIQLIIMDMIMPNKSGKVAYDEIKQIKPGAKALFSSGYSASIVQQQGELGKNAEFISKPVQPAELLRKVREMLDG